jgi:hypothetical protein
MLKNKIRVINFFATILFVLNFNVSFAMAFDFSGWDALVKKHVNTATIIEGVVLNSVAYKNLKGDPGYKKLIEALKTASLDDLKTKEEKLSFWINTYNILAVKVVLDNYPVKSIKDVGSLFKQVWKRPAGVVAGKERTLNEVEHEILRKMGEPRIHVAIVCASVSCPDLRKEAFTPDKLGEQLDDQVKMFLENTGKGMKIDAKKKRVYVSSIFKWFEEDFEPQGGVTAFISRYVSPSRQASFNQYGGKLKYLDYNWDLNE